MIGLYDRAITTCIQFVHLVQFPTHYKMMAENCKVFITPCLFHAFTW